MSKRKVTTHKTECPYCGEWTSTVKDARPHYKGFRRKRQCANAKCRRMYFTIERSEAA